MSLGQLVVAINSSQCACRRCHHNCHAIPHVAKKGCCATCRPPTPSGDWPADSKALQQQHRRLKAGAQPYLMRSAMAFGFLSRRPWYSSMLLLSR